MLKVSDKPTWLPLWLAAGACQCITGIELRLHMLQYMLQHLAHRQPSQHWNGRSSDSPFSDPSRWCLGKKLCISARLSQDMLICCMSSNRELMLICALR